MKGSASVAIADDGLDEDSGGDGNDDAEAIPATLNRADGDAGVGGGASVPFCRCWRAADVLHSVSVSSESSESVLSVLSAEEEEEDDVDDDGEASSSQESATGCEGFLGFAFDLLCVSFVTVTVLELVLLDGFFGSVDMDSRSKDGRVGFDVAIGRSIVILCYIRYYISNMRWKMPYSLTMKP